MAKAAVAAKKTKTRPRHNPYKLLVGDVLNREVVVVGADATVHESLQMMGANRVAVLPVLDRTQRCVGIISASDLLSLARELDEDLEDLRLGELSHQWLAERLAEHDMDRRPVTELMTDKVESATPQTPIVKAARKMLRGNIHRLPVLDTKGRLVGIVSTTDILAAFIDAAP
ncbi:MAG: CBS domain-containing protein [Planctomycetia bacterium]|nr:CBS domain-containing protein [Planctomycetia bacterium]